MRAGESQDFELNLASIIDCFTVLIAFMLATASFLSIGVLDAGMAAAGAEAKSQAEPPPVQLVLTLRKDHSVLLELSGRESRKEEIPALGQSTDLESLGARLKATQGRWSALQSATLQAENQVPYRDVIQAMDVTRKTLPAVLLGGF